jgi:transcriptional regulator with XRE-family HTH domain
LTLIVEILIIALVQLNVALKMAVLESGKEQGEIAALARIHFTRLSQIVRGRVNPTESEQLRLAGVLQKSVDQLFPAVESAERAS